MNFFAAHKQALKNFVASGIPQAVVYYPVSGTYDAVTFWAAQTNKATVVYKYDKKGDKEKS
jgi:hypothetical protein